MFLKRLLKRAGYLFVGAGGLVMVLGILGDETKAIVGGALAAVVGVGLWLISDGE